MSQLILKIFLLFNLDMVVLFCNWQLHFKQHQVFKQMLKGSVIPNVHIPDYLESISPPLFVDCFLPTYLSNPWSFTYDRVSHREGF